MDFFSNLDKHVAANWNSDFLLKVFGSSGLRKFEMPARWLQEKYSITLSPDAKRADAELRTAHKLLHSMRANTAAGQVLEAFFDELHRRLSVGKIKPRSMRMALRPAVSLLQMASVDGSQLPSQKTLYDMLHTSPGQRAAVSTFLGFLKARHDIVLVLPKPTSKRLTTAREKLGQRLAQIGNEQYRNVKTLDQWIVTALRYFHRLSKVQAMEITKTATRVAAADGYELHMGEQVFWLPGLPSSHANLSQPLKAANTTQQIEDLRLRRGTKPQKV